MKSTNSSQKQKTKPFTEETQKVEVEDRFRRLEISVPALEDGDWNERQQSLKRWLGLTVMKIFSHSFLLMQSEKLDKNKTRSFCCGNLIYNII